MTTTLTSLHSHSLSNESPETALMRSSLEQLEFPKILETIAKRCISEIGHEHIQQSFPTEQTSWLREEHARINEALSSLQRDILIPLDGFTDIRPQISKASISGAFLQPNELLDVRDTLRASRLVKKFVYDNGEMFPALSAFCGTLHENRLFEKHISDAIDDNGTVKDSASRELLTIRRNIIAMQNSIRQKLQRILKKVLEEEVVMEEYITQREGRLVLPMKVEYKRSIAGIIHGVSGSGQTVFMEPAETYEMNNELSLLRNEEDREIVRILTTLTAEISEETWQIAQSVDILGALDAIIAKARYANDFGGIVPEITDDNEVYLADARHPLLVQAKGRKFVQPLTISFEGNAPGHLISGPNAGGKTVALKSIGLNIALALSGIFPIGVCRTNFRTIFSAIGDNQSIENDVSTFSSQVIRMREILLSSSSVSLVLIDEICSGTDPQEGAALAVGIIEGMIARNSFFVVTTHQSSLKSYALSRPEIKNACMEFNSERLEPTYKFLSGVPGNSYAFALAKKLGLPPAVMARAHDYLGDKHNELERSIEAIQTYRSEAETVKEQARKELQKAEKKREQYEARFAEFSEKYKELIRAAKLEAAEIVQGANKLIEETVRNVREQQKPIAEIKREYEQSKQILQEAANKLKIAKKPQETGSFAVGQSVTMDDSTQVGTIISLDDEAAIVEFGSIKFKVLVEKLRTISGNQQHAARPIKKSGVDVKFDAATRLDLRGKYSDEAIKEVELAIGDALRGAVQQITIVHGKGTGALRIAIQQHLAKHPSVEKYRDGLLSEGGSGVTIVDLK